MQSCDEYPQNSFCYCLNPEGESVPQYKQHNSSGKNIGVGYSCCNKLKYQPSTIANIEPYTQKPLKDVYTYINLISPSDNSCDYTKYFGGYKGTTASLFLKKNYPELYSYAKTSMEIFNNYYCKEAYSSLGIYSLIKNNKDLIPIITERNIFCPNDNFVPQILSFREDSKETEDFLYICFPKNVSYPSLNFPYTIYSILDNNNLDGKINNINTVYSPTAPLNIGSVIHTTRNRKLSNVVIGIVVGLFVLVSILIFLNTYKKQKLRMKKI